MENNKLDDFLKQQMSIEGSGVEQPDLSLISEARKKIEARKKKDRETFFDIVRNVLTFRVKLYQAGIATVLIALTVFYVTDRDQNKNAKKSIQYADVDTLKSSSVKQNTLLVKNFSVRIN